jgi:hypothetical protein
MPTMMVMMMMMMINFTVITMQLRVKSVPNYLCGHIFFPANFLTFSSCAYKIDGIHALVPNKCITFPANLTFRRESFSIYVERISANQITKDLISAGIEA